MSQLSSKGVKAEGVYAEFNAWAQLAVPHGHDKLNIATATTTLVKAGAGVLHRVIVNTTAAGAITIYDSLAASGTKIAALKSSIGENSFEFNVAFDTGLTVVTAAASDITVVYR